MKKELGRWNGYNFSLKNKTLHIGPYSLTPREYEILILLGQLQEKQIAQKLGISLGYVKNIISVMYDHNNTPSNRANFVKVFYGLGLLWPLSIVGYRSLIQSQTKSPKR